MWEDYTKIAAIGIGLVAVCTIDRVAATGYRTVCYRRIKAGITVTDRAVNSACAIIPATVKMLVHDVRRVVMTTGTLCCAAGLGRLTKGYISMFCGIIGVGVPDTMTGFTGAAAQDGDGFHRSYRYVYIRMAGVAATGGMDAIQVIAGTCIVMTNNTGGCSRHIGVRGRMTAVFGIAGQ